MDRGVTVVLDSALGEVRLGLASSRKDARFAILLEGTFLCSKCATLSYHHCIGCTVLHCARINLQWFKAYSQKERAKHQDRNLDLNTFAMVAAPETTIPHPVLLRIQHMRTVADPPEITLIASKDLSASDSTVISRPSIRTSFPLTMMQADFENLTWK